MPRHALDVPLPAAPEQRADAPRPLPWGSFHRGPTPTAAAPAPAAADEQRDLDGNGMNHGEGGRFAPKDGGGAAEPSPDEKLKRAIGSYGKRKAEEGRAGELAVAAVKAKRLREAEHLESPSTETLSKKDAADAKYREAHQVHQAAQAATQAARDEAVKAALEHPRRTDAIKALDRGGLRSVGDDVARAPTGLTRTHDQALAEGSRTPDQQRADAEAASRVARTTAAHAAAWAADRTNSAAREGAQSGIAALHGMRARLPQEMRDRVDAAVALGKRADPDARRELAGHAEEIARLGDLHAVDQHQRANEREKAGPKDLPAAAPAKDPYAGVKITKVEAGASGDTGKYSKVRELAARAAAWAGSWMPSLLGNPFAAEARGEFDEAAHPREADGKFAGGGGGGGGGHSAGSASGGERKFSESEHYILSRLGEGKHDPGFAKGVPLFGSKGLEKAVKGLAASGHAAITTDDHGMRVVSLTDKGKAAKERGAERRDQGNLFHGFAAQQQGISFDEAKHPRGEGGKFASSGDAASDRLRGAVADAHEAHFAYHDPRVTGPSLPRAAAAVAAGRAIDAAAAAHPDPAAVREIAKEAVRKLDDDPRSGGHLQLGPVGQRLHVLASPTGSERDTAIKVKAMRDAAPASSSPAHDALLVGALGALHAANQERERAVGAAAVAQADHAALASPQTTRALSSARTKADALLDVTKQARAAAEMAVRAHPDKAYAEAVARAAPAGRLDDLAGRLAADARYAEKARGSKEPTVGEKVQAAARQHALNDLANGAATRLAAVAEKAGGVGGTIGHLAQSAAVEGAKEASRDSGAALKAAIAAHPSPGEARQLAARTHEATQSRALGL